MSKRLPQDLSRFKKTYSYSLQEPVLAVTVSLSSRDLTRFRKTYSQTRQKPVNPVPIPKVPGAYINSLTLSFRVKAGDCLAYSAPANGGAGSVVWVGTPSAGNSGNVDAWVGVSHPGFLGGLAPTLDGKQTVNFTTEGVAFFAAPANANARAGTAGGSETPYADQIAANLLGATTGTIWALVYVVSIVDGDRARVIGAGTQGNIGIGGGVLTHSAEWRLGGSFNNDLTLATGVWSVLQLRYDSGAGELKGRINKGAWTTWACGAPTSGQTFTLGPIPPVYGADYGASAQWLDDATMDLLYDDLKALWPSAGLP